MTARVTVRDNRPAFLGPPRTRAGWLSVGLAGGFFALFAAWLAYSNATPVARPTFFSDPIHAVLLLAAVASAESGLIVGVVTVLRGRERSLALLPGLLLGVVVLLLTIGEIRGHG